MQSKAKNVKEYLAELPADRRAAVQAIREVILKNMDKAGGLEEGMSYGMIGYVVPHSVWPAGYHCDPSLPLMMAAVASQKNHFALYLMCVYGNEEVQDWFRKAWTAAGKKLDMGKGCVRFRKIEDVPLEVVGELFRRMTVAKFLGVYQKALGMMDKQREERAAAKKTGKAMAGRPARRTGAKRAGKAKARR